MSEWEEVRGVPNYLSVSDVGVHTVRTRTKVKGGTVGGWGENTCSMP